MYGEAWIMKMSFYKEDEDLFKELEEALQRNLSVEAVEASISVAKIIKSLQLKEYIVVTALLQYFYCFNPSLCKKELENVSKGLADYQNQSLIKSINLLEEYKDYLALFERLETYTSVELAMYKDEDKQNIFEKNINYYEQLFGNQECLYILTASRITELKLSLIHI